VFGRMICNWVGFDWDSFEEFGLVVVYFGIVNGFGVWLCG